MYPVCVPHKSINYGSNLHFYLVILIFFSSFLPALQILAHTTADPEATNNGQSAAGQKCDGQINSGLDSIHEPEPGVVNAERARLKADAELLKFVCETAATARNSNHHNRCK